MLIFHRTDLRCQNKHVRQKINTSIDFYYFSVIIAALEKTVANSRVGGASTHRPGGLEVAVDDLRLGGVQEVDALEHAGQGVHLHLEKHGERV